MRVDLPALLPLICPACRSRSERGLELHVLELERGAPGGDGDDVREGVLRCSHCARRYPIIDGIPVVVSDMSGFLARELGGLLEPDLDPEVAGLLALAGPDDALCARVHEMLSTYLDAHWGERATPPPDGPGARAGADPLFATLAARSTVLVDSAVELGCSVGRGLWELAGAARLVVGIDVSLAALRRARRLFSGRDLVYPRRVVGRRYRAARIAAPAPPAGTVELVCADAQDPPLPPARFDRVAALNVLDAVHDPGALLAVATGLCRAGGELHLASPYAWQSAFVGEPHRLGGDDPAAEVARRLRDRGFAVEEERDIGWTLRRDARSAVSYSVHYLRARAPELGSLG